MKWSSSSKLAALGLLGALVGCTREKDPRVCNAGTLLLEFQCEDDLKDASELRFRLARGEESGTELSTSLSCPGVRRYEVSIGDYVAGQSFRLSATPSSDGAPLGQPNTVDRIDLEPGCTRVQVPLKIEGGVAVPKEDAAVDQNPEDGGAPEPRLDASTERGPKNRGETCSSGSECQTGFCADGVCCESACVGPCFSCALMGNMGSCSPTPDGVAPAMPKQCATQPAAMCGFDGKCDGAGSCRKHPDGTVCAQGTCEGTGSRERKVCAGGSCSAEKNLVCGTFLCDSASVTCFAECETDSQCEPGKSCKLDPDTNKKSCGKKLIGASCDVGGECESGFCADGVCCNQACTGACLSCDQLNKVGECSPVPAGADDKRKICKATEVAGCGETGKCDGNGACAKYAKGTVCGGAMCSGNDGIPASECDGNGTCVAGKPIACAPNVCRGNTCLDKCMTDADCTGGAVCTNGSCGLKPLGASCKNQGECASGHCADGFCCNKACAGTCEYCAFSTNRGKCTTVPAGDDDPRDDCKAKNPSTCKENGKCNGNGACQLFGEGTPCSEQSCNATTNMQVYAKQCDGLGTCKKVREDTSCAPHTCGGNACADSCSRDDQCVAPNSCVGSLCGKRKPGQLCSNNDQCSSGICTGEGVCCTSQCSGTCRSCKVAGKEGTCSDVPAGQDPLNQCEAQANSPCGPTGTCDGAGKCALQATGVICAGATCSADNSKEIGASTCDGAGKCSAPAGNTCQSDLVCSGSSCKASCSTDADCRNGKTCNTRTKQCGPANGAGCGSNADCGSDKCVDGYCCNSDCSGACESCAAKDTNGMNGVCAALPSGASDTACPPASCSADKKTATPASTCDGARKCTTPMAKPCGDFSCNNGVCLLTCTKDTDCLDSSKECKESQCKKKLSVVCSAAGECASGFCAPDGVCCDKACTGVCQACNSAGVCTSLSGSYPNECVPSECGFTGQCVSGACQTVANDSPCGSKTSTCTTSGQVINSPACLNQACVTPKEGNCINGFLCREGGCPTSCTSDSHCQSGYYCDGTTCKTKKSQGSSCKETKECSASLTCVNDVCCESTCGSACMACSKALNGVDDGLCRARTNGTSDSRCNDSSSCGHTGKCNGQGACVYKQALSSCGTDLYCDGAGSCGCSDQSECPAGRICQAGGKCLGPQTCEAAQCTTTQVCVWKSIESIRACVDASTAKCEKSGPACDEAPYASCPATVPPGGGPCSFSAGANECFYCLGFIEMVKASCSGGQWSLYLESADDCSD